MTDMPEVTVVSPTSSFDQFQNRKTADSIVSSVVKRSKQERGNMAEVSYRAGIVAGSPSGGKVSVKLGGDTTESPNFRVPSGMSLALNDKVIVVINPAGDRWVGWKF